MKEEPSFFSEDLKLIFFGGKGGVGKTTCAAATALHLSNKGRKTLIFSTDPAHSLSDSFGIQIGNKITPIKDNLYGLEMDTKELIEEFKNENEITITKIVERGTYLDTYDITEMLSRSLPGMDEYMAILKIRELMRDGEYDLFISDTAPTGHTIRLLLTPRLMEEWVDFLDKLEDKHRYITRTFRGGYKKDETDAFLEKMHIDLRRVIATFTDLKTEFVPVTIPEAMGVEETEDLLSAVENLGIHVRSIIINRANLSIGECDFCAHRVKDQERYMKQIFEKVEKYNVIQIPLFPHEIRGVEGLNEFSEVLAGKPYVYKPVTARKPREKRAESRIKDLLHKELKILFFGGKGGVGKTTVSSASALYIARRNPEKKILIFSTDPAHSLSDSFDFYIGSKVTQIENNLYGLEIDAEAAMAEFREEYTDAIKEAFDAFVSGDGRITVDLPFDRAIFQRLKGLTPPGLDEMMALSKIVELIESDDFDLIILDTAPTGHTIRLLELPDIALGWYTSFAGIINKYRREISLLKTMRLVLEKKREMAKTIKILRNEEETEFVVVTIPEAMSISETKKFLAELKKAGIYIEHIVINDVIPATGCSFCISQMKNQEDYIKEVSELDYKITEIPLFAHEIRGIDMLADFGELIYGDKGEGKREENAPEMGIGRKLHNFFSFFMLWLKRWKGGEKK